MQDLQAVLFDLDGTLIDTVDLIRASFRYATKTVLGREVPDEILMSQVGKPLWVQMNDLDPERADELVRVYREHNALVHDDLIKEYPGVEETLADLKRQGFPMGVVTSKAHIVARRGLDRFGLSKYFDVLLGYDDVAKPKPDSCPLYTAAGELGVDLGHSIYLGDSPFDMQAAISGGAISVAALWGAFTAREVLEPGPQYALAQIADLTDLVNGGSQNYLARRIA